MYSTFKRFVIWHCLLATSPLEHKYIAFADKRHSQHSKWRSAWHLTARSPLGLWVVRSSWVLSFNCRCNQFYPREQLSRGQLTPCVFDMMLSSAPNSLQVNLVFGRISLRPSCAHSTRLTALILRVFTLLHKYQFCFDQYIHTYIFF